MGCEKGFTTAGGCHTCGLLEPSTVKAARMGGRNREEDLTASQPLNILLVGPRRTGKSSTGNTLLGRGRVFDTRGGGASTTAGGIVAGRRLTVVDAQGWGLSEGTVPKKDKVELLRAMSLFGLGGPHVVLLVIPLLDFTESEGRAVERRMEVLTSTVWRHTMVLFTCGDRLKRRGCSAREHVQSGGAALQGLMEKCRYRYHVFNNKAVAGRGSTRQETGSTQQEGTWRRNIAKGLGWKNRGGEREEGEQEQVRELLTKVENMLQENGGWHFSLHMYRRMEEEWSRREGELRSRLAAESGGGRERRGQAGTGNATERRQKAEMEVGERGFDRTTTEREVNTWEGREEEEEVDVSSEEEGYDSREESTDTETGPVAPRWLNTSQSSGLNPLTSLA